MRPKRRLLKQLPYERFLWPLSSSESQRIMDRQVAAAGWTVAYLQPSGTSLDARVLVPEGEVCQLTITILRVELPSVGRDPGYVSSSFGRCGF